MIDADYADDLMFLANPLAQAESQLYSLDQAMRDISLCVNTKKKQSTCVLNKKEPFPL